MRALVPQSVRSSWRTSEIRARVESSSRTNALSRFSGRAEPPKELDKSLALGVLERLGQALRQLRDIDCGRKVGRDPFVALGELETAQCDKSSLAGRGMQRPASARLAGLSLCDRARVSPDELAIKRVNGSVPVRRGNRRISGTARDPSGIPARRLAFFLEGQSAKELENSLSLVRAPFLTSDNQNVSDVKKGAGAATGSRDPCQVRVP
jgi:hypothetical protein